MKLSSFSVTFIAFVSITLVVMSDIPLNDMLGEHPLQSELSFVEDHVKKTNQQKKVGANPSKEHNTNDPLLSAVILLTLLLIGLTLFAYHQRSLARAFRIKAKGDERINLSNVIWGLAAFFLVTASYYFIQSQQQFKELAPFVKEMLIREKQGGPSKQHEKDQKELVAHLSSETHRRNGLAKIIAGLGLLASLSALGLKYSERNSSS